MKKRREAQSSALSFIDCICCGFGAVLLLFILTAKKQIDVTLDDIDQTWQAAEILQEAIEETQAEQKALERQIEVLDPQPETETTSLAELAAKQERLAKQVENQSQALEALKSEEPTEQPASLDRPTASQHYLAGLRLRGPRVVILLENAGSMLADNASDAVEIMQQGTWQESEKWQRARESLKSVLAAIPKGTKVAVLQMADSASPISGSPDDPYIDPYDNAALISLLDRLENLEARGGANFTAGMRVVSELPERPSSLLLITDGLPTSPAPSGRGVTEEDRVQLFNRSMATQANYPFNILLFPFEGDPRAAGLFWELSSRTGGSIIVPDRDWPAI